FFSAMFPSSRNILLSHGLQIGIQAVEAFFPVLSIEFHPVSDFLKRLGSKPTWPPLRLPSSLDKAGALQHFEVLGDGRQSHVKWLGKFRDRGLARGEPIQNGP